MRLIRRNPPPGSIAVAEKTAGPSAPGNLGRRRSRGQSLVEFSLILTPLALVLLGLLQFGFIFNAYITMTNAVRESARIGTIYIYDRTQSKSQNDTARNNQMRTSLVASFNQLQSTSPNFTSSSTWTQSGQTYTTDSGFQSSVIIREKRGRIAASVLPPAVGALKSVVAPDRMGATAAS